MVPLLTEQENGGIPTGNPNSPRMTHCVVSLPSCDSTPFFKRRFDEHVYRLPHEFEQWNCDHLIYFFHFNVGTRVTRVVQSDWLYESVRTGKRLGPEEDWGGWRVE